MTVTDLIEELIEMRSKLQKQMKVFGAGGIQGGDKSRSAATQITTLHLKNCISELNKLLKEHAQIGKP